MFHGILGAAQPVKRKGTRSTTQSILTRTFRGHQQPDDIESLHVTPVDAPRENAAPQSLEVDFIPSHEPGQEDRPVLAKQRLLAWLDLRRAVKDEEDVSQFDVFCTWLRSTDQLLRKCRRCAQRCQRCPCMSAFWKMVASIDGLLE